MENAKLTIRYPTVFPKNGSLVLYPIGTMAERPAPAPTHHEELVHALLPNAPGESLLDKDLSWESVIRDPSWLFLRLSLGAKRHTRSINRLEAPLGALAVAICCAAVARASPSLAYFRFPLTGHFDSLFTTSPEEFDGGRRFRSYARRTSQTTKQIINKVPSSS